MSEKTKENMKEGTVWIDYIEVPTWWGRGGGMLHNREYLPFDHPEQRYNYIKRKLQEAHDSGIKRDDKLLKPEDFGEHNPKAEFFKEYSRNDLIDEIMELRKTIESYEFHQVPMRCYP